MLRLPINCMSPYSGYENNEAYSDGKYPVSESNHWHSGIHINYKSGSANTNVYPLVSGELAAYRISKNFKTVPRPNTVNDFEWMKLSGDEQKLYEKSGEIYSLKAAISPEDRNEKYSNSFVLLKHHFNIRKRGVVAVEKIPFFTLYTNIIPSDLDENPDYRNLSTAPKEIPFYHTYYFRVNTELTKAYKYTTKEKTRLFPGSHCTYWEKDEDNDNYECSFANFDNLDTKIPVSKNYIEALSYYTPIADGIPIYKIDGTVITEDVQNNPDTAENVKKLENKKLGTLTKDAYFTKNIVQRGKFYEVTVFKSEIHNATTTVEESQRVLVRIKDVQGKGRIKAENELCDETIKGVMVYDAVGGNARDILEAGEEFDLVNPEGLIKNNSGGYYRLKREDKRYILYEDSTSNPLQVKVDWGADYTFDSTASPSTQIKIGDNTLLGCAFKQPRCNHAYYDVVLFFNNKSFLDGQYETIERYFIPRSMVLYRMTNNDRSKAEFEESRFTWPFVFEATGHPVNSSENVVYDEFIDNGSFFYLPLGVARQYKADMTELKKFFRVLTNEVNTIEEAIDGLEFIKANYDWNRDSENVGGVLKDSVPDWWQEKRADKRPLIESIKRSIICSHPLEWDSEQYIEGGKVKLKIQFGYETGYFPREHEYFKTKVDAVDIWKELNTVQVDGLDTSKNRFWFAHPIYFLRHLDDAELFQDTVLPVKSQYLMGDERWATEYLPNTEDTKKENDKMEKSGCVITLLANVAHTFGKTGITPLTICNGKKEDFDNDGNMKWLEAPKTLGLIADRVESPLTINEYEELNKGTTQYCIGIQAPYNDANPKGLHWVGVTGTAISDNGEPCFIVSATSGNDIVRRNDRFDYVGWIMTTEEPVQVYIPESIVTGYVKFSLQKQGEL